MRNFIWVCFVVVPAQVCILEPIIFSMSVVFLRRNNCCLQIIRGLLEPIVTPDDLVQQPQPVTLLFELCQKNGKNVDIKHWRNNAKSIASVYVDGHFVASASAEQKDIAKLDAAKAALHKLGNLVPASTGLLDFCPGIDGTFEIEAAKQVLHELCGKKKWSKPEYRQALLAC